jgi:hypothetical protein
VACKQARNDNNVPRFQTETVDLDDVLKRGWTPRNILDGATVDELLPKPFSLDAILEVIARVAR